MSQSNLLAISSLSTEYLRVGFRYTSTSVSPIDPTLFPVFMAFKKPDVEPTDLDWVAADWSKQNGAIYIICLIGPDTGAAIALADGFYNVWVKVSGNPETIVKVAGSVTIT